jgi:gliding motility-associated-like protein
MATAKNGCIRTENKTIEVNNDYNLLAPIAFTPNSDGLNDVFIPEALKVLNLPFKMNIYDRQQGLVYQTARIDGPWDGKSLKSGEACAQGAYLWMVELTGKNGKVEMFSGTITILK